MTHNNARGVIYGFRGGMTLLCRDETLSPRDSKVFGKKLALAHVDFRPALAHEQTAPTHSDAQADEYYIGSIAMESDFNPNKRDFFAPTAYRCLLRKAPNGTKWDDVRARTEENPRNRKSGREQIIIPGKSATIPLGLDCDLTPDGIFDLKNGETWNREDDLQYGGSPYSWRWYFNRLNINRHISDLLIACPAVYSRWPRRTDVAVALARTEARRLSHNAGRRRKDKLREAEQE